MQVVNMQAEEFVDGEMLCISRLAVGITLN